MKKIFFGILAVVAMIATSCQQEVDLGVEVGKTATVSFEVGTPTRAYSDGLTATKLEYAVYEGTTELGDLTVSTEKNNTVTMENRTATINLQLVTGNEYTVIFWASNPNNDSYEVDWATGTMTVKDYTSAVSNDETRDAFYAAHTFTVNGAQTETITLKRPFAQLNIGTSDYDASTSAGYTPVNSRVKVSEIYSTLNLWNGEVAVPTTVSFAHAAIEKDEKFPVAGHEYLAMNYLLVDASKELINVEFAYTESDKTAEKVRTVGSVPVQRNYRTNLYGQLLTSDTKINIEIEPAYEDDNKYEVIDGKVNITVDDATEFNSAIENADVIILGEDINLNDLTRAAADPTYTIASGKTLTIDLAGHKLSATSAAAKNYEVFLVKGTLAIKNGTIEYEYKGENMGWSAMTTIFDVTAGGVLNLENVTAKNLGGSDMGFVAHLNNWGEVTLNAENCTLESNYVAVRVFNSGPDMNNVTIKNSTLKGVSAAFWVHNYTVADFGTEAKAEAQKALLNLNIYNQGNTFSPDVNGIRYGFTNSVRSDAYGITKSVSEDGTEVTLGSVVENGLIRRGVAGAEENTTIKKVVVEEGVATLYDRTFRRFYALETVELPSTLTTIGAAGSGVFQSCSALKNIVIPESVTVLGKGTFQECTSLESINIPAGVTRIEENCLRNTGLVEVEFHEGVTYFGAQSFRDCKQLKKVVINAPSFTVEANAFGVMSGTLPGTTILVANAEMKAYLESTLAYANQFNIVCPEVVNNAVELNAAIGTLADGGTIVLGADFSFTTEEGGRYNNGGWWDGLGYSGDKSFTLDLNGHTLGNANGALNDYLLWFKNDGAKANTITIKNGTLDAGTTAYCALATSSSNKQTITINLENVTLYNNNSNGAVAKIRAGAVLNVKAGTKIIGKNSYTGIESAAATTNIYEGAEIYQNGTSSQWGFLAGASGGGVINVYGGTGVSARGGFMAMTSGGTINVYGGEWIANVNGTIGNNSNVYVLTAQSNIDESGFVGGSFINVYGGTFRGGMDAWILHQNTAEQAGLSISGGNFNANPSSYLAEGATATENGGIWTVTK